MEQEQVEPAVQSTCEMGPSSPPSANKVLQPLHPLRKAGKWFAYTEDRYFSEMREGASPCEGNSAQISPPPAAALPQPESSVIVSVALEPTPNHGAPRDTSESTAAPPASVQQRPDPTSGTVEMRGPAPPPPPQRGVPPIPLTPLPPPVDYGPLLVTSDCGIPQGCLQISSTAMAVPAAAPSSVGGIVLSGLNLAIPPQTLPSLLGTIGIPQQQAALTTGEATPATTSENAGSSSVSVQTMAPNAAATAAEVVAATVAAAAASSMAKKLTEKKPRKRRSEQQERRFPCSYCEKAFTARSSLDVHERIHTGERPYKCDQCGKQFRHCGHLTCHLRTHTGERPYICRVCGKGFTQSTPCRRHEQTQHSIP